MTFIVNGRPDPDLKEDILDTLVSRAEENFGDDLNPDEVSVIRSHYDPVAEYFADQQSDLSGVLDASQLDYAEEEALDFRASQIGVDRKEAEAATTRLQFARDGPTGTTYTVPEGTEARTDAIDPIAFETTASTAIRFIEGFEDNNLDDFSGDLATFSTVTSTVYDGTYALEGGSSVGQLIDTSVDLTEGDTAHCRIYANANTIPSVLFGVQDSDSMYRAVVDSSAGELKIELNDDGSVSDIGTPTSSTIPTGEWLHLQIDWKHDGEIELTLNDSSESEVATVSGTDSNTTFTEGGIGFRSGDSNATKYFDNLTMSATSVDAEAVETGPESNVGANTLVILPSSPTGIQSVTNPIGSSGGRDNEEDDDLRERAKDELSEGMRGTVSGLISQLQKTDGTKSITVEENDSNSTDADGRPAHSVECIVEVGSDNYDDVAQTIAETKSGGIPAVGGHVGTKIDRTVELDSGHTVGIEFSVPTDIQIYADIGLSKTDEYAGDDAVSDAIVNYVGGTLTSGDEKDGELDAGDDVIYNSIMAAVASVEGVYDVTTLGVGTSANPTGTSNITVGSNEVATANATDGSLSVTTSDV